MMRRSVEFERDAVIEDVKLYTNNPYLLDEIKECHKMAELTDTPEGIQDLIVVTANTKNEEGEMEKVTDFFPVVIKYDGTLQTQSLTRKNRLRRTRFMGFLKHYGLTGDIKGYVIPRNMNKWIGKKVKVVIYEGRGQIHVPKHLLNISTEPERD